MVDRCCTSTWMYLYDGTTMIVTEIQFSSLKVLGTTALPTFILNCNHAYFYFCGVWRYLCYVSLVSYYDSLLLALVQLSIERNSHNGSSSEFPRKLVDSGR